MSSSDMDLIEDTHAVSIRTAPWPLLARLPALLAEARGEVVVINGNFGLRITELAAQPSAALLAG